MNTREQIDAAVRTLRERGVGALTAAPPMFQALWRVGMLLPPPLFMSFARLAVVAGFAFAVLFAALAWLLRGGTFREGFTLEAASAALAGVLFCVIMAGYFRYRAQRLGLPSWSEFVAQLPRR